MLSSRLVREGACLQLSTLLVGLFIVLWVWGGLSFVLLVVSCLGLRFAVYLRGLVLSVFADLFGCFG